MSGLLPLLTRNSQFGKLIDALRLGLGREAIVAPDPATAYLVAAIWREFGAPVVVVTPNPEAARRLTDQLGVWQAGAPLFQFAETENIPFEHYVPDILSTHQRLQALAALIEPPAGRPPIVVASIQAVAQSTIDRATFDQAAGAICAGDSVSPAELVRRWTDIGYRIEPTVEVPGSASRRGGILDVFPVTSPQPARMDFFGDEVESIRLFDPYTQRSTGTVDSITIPPARETLPSIANEERVQDRLSKLNLDWCNPELQQRIPAELGQALRGELTDRLSYYSGFFNGGSLFDYMPDDSLLVVLRPTGVEEAARTTDARLSALRERKERRGEAPRRFPLPHIEWGFLADAMSGRSRRLDISPWGAGSPVLQSEDQATQCRESRRLDISPWGAGSPEERSHSPPQDAHALIDDMTRLPLEPAPLAGRSIERALELAGHGSNSGRRYVFMTNHALRVADVANERGLNARVETALDETPAEGTVRIVQGHLRQGFTLGGKPGDGFTLLTDHEIFGVTKERRRVRRRHVRRGPLLEQLKPGSFVVHVEHGVARFTGTHVMDSRDGREFLVLEYADGDKLYVPTDHLDRIQFYHGSGDAQPRLTRLGTQEWSRAKARARRATEQLAGELMALYAARSVVAGFQSEADTPWQDALEASFPYEETPDQLTTIDAVKEDLLAPQPMDRLVCGDVGYGKTEVALRAAFKVVQSGRQVAILVPTTVLAQQHFATFTERLAPYPVRVEMLSRFRSPSNQKSVVAGLASGQVDICIGTHRILQRDVSVKNLGLAVIDEEHKFGVTHKETTEAVADAGRRADPLGDADSAHASHGAGRCAGHEHHRDPAGGAAADQDLCVGGERRACARGNPARAGPRRPGLLPAQPCTHDRSRGRAHSPPCPGGPHRHRARADARRRTGAGDVGLLRARVRRAGLYHDHRVRHRSSECEHIGDRPGRHVRALAALPGARAHRPRHEPCLCLSDGAARQAACRKRPSSDSTRSLPPPNWAPGSRSPCGTWRFGAWGTYSAPSRAGT